MMNERNETNAVRQIILEELKANNRVSKLYVWEQIKNRVHPTRLYNKALRRKRTCQDGGENTHRGAKAFFSDSWRRLKKEFAMDAEGWITFRPEADTEALSPGAFAVRPSGNIGQEVLDPDGKVVAWTTDAWVAQVIAKLLSENEHLLITKKVSLDKVE